MGLSIEIAIICGIGPVTDVAISGGMRAGVE